MTATAAALALAIPAQAAGTPTGVAIAVSDTDVPLGQGSFTVTWQPVSGAIAYSVIAYLGSTNQVAASQSVAAPATTAVLTSLTGGQRYEVTVAAADRSGFGTASARLSATALTVPAPPQGMAREYDSTSQTTSVTWVRPSSEGGSPILTYEVLRDGQVATAVSGSVTTASIDGDIALDRLAVRATNAVGTSAVGSSASVPGAPRTVQATSSGSTVNVSWLAPLDNGGATISGYQTTLEAGGVVQYQTASATTSATIGSVANGSYTVVVRAQNSAGLGASASGSVTVSASSESPAPNPGQVPGAPTGVSATAGNAEVVVTWTAPTSQGSFPITNYRVTSSPGGATCLSTTTTCTVQGLTNGTAYTFTVAALNGAGFGPESVASAPVTPQGDPSPSPSPTPTPTPTPSPSPTPTPTPADVELPGRVVAVRGAETRIVMEAQGRVPLKTLRLGLRVNGRVLDLNADFTRRAKGVLRASFVVQQRPGSYALVLTQLLDGERFVLDRSTLTVNRR